MTRRSSSKPFRKKISPGGCCQPRSCPPVKASVFTTCRRLLDMLTAHGLFFKPADRLVPCPVLSRQLFRLVAMLNIVLPYHCITVSSSSHHRIIVSSPYHQYNHRILIVSSPFHQHIITVSSLYHHRIITLSSCHRILAVSLYHRIIASSPYHHRTIVSSPYHCSIIVSPYHHCIIIISPYHHCIAAGHDRLHVNACGVLDVLMADNGTNNTMLMVQHSQVSWCWCWRLVLAGGWLLVAEGRISDLAAHFSRNSGAENTVLFTIQTFNEHSRMAKLHIYEATCDETSQDY